MKAGDHVGILATNCIEWVEAMYGIYKIRARVVNVNFRYVEEEMRYLFENSDLVAFVYQREYGPIVASARSAQPKLQHFFRIEWDDSDADDSALDPIEFEAAIASGSPERDFGERSDDDVYLLYTGGTTGMPKGVMWRQEDVYYALGGGIDAITNERVAAPDDGERQDRRVAPRGLVSSLPIPPLMHGAGQFSIFRTHVRRQHRGDRRQVRRRRRLAPRREARSQHDRRHRRRDGAPARRRARAMQGDVDLSSLFSFSSTAAIFSQTVKEQLRSCCPRTS